jgi:hypothetical protein
MTPSSIAVSALIARPLITASPAVPCRLGTPLSTPERAVRESIRRWHYLRGVAPSESIWERIDLPVLRYVQEFPYNMEWRFDRSGPTEELPELEGEEVDESLRRLRDHGLVWWHDRTETSGFFSYVRLRLTPDGLRVLGEWPPSEEAQLGAALVQVLLALADDAQEPEAKPVRRAAGAVGRFANDVLFDVAKGELNKMGGDIT